MNIVAVLLLFLLPTHIVTQSLTLTDKTWKDMLCGQWMVEFYAPWCPSCQHFKPIWDEFSKEMIPKEIKVAAVDINEYPSLSGRFGISVLPTIYYVRDGVFRQFNGERSLKGLKDYIEFQDWKRTQPVSSYLAPDGVAMSIVGSIFDVSLLVRDAYTVLKDQYGLPAWSIYIVLALAVITVGLVLGFGVLMLIDYCLMGSSKVEPSDIPDDSRDIEEIEDDDDEEDQRLLRPKKPTTATASRPAFVTSSTPQRATGKASDRFTPAIPVEDEGVLLHKLLDDDDDDDDERNSPEGSNASDVAAESDENEEPAASNVRHRRREKRSN